MLEGLHDSGVQILAMAQPLEKASYDQKSDAGVLKSYRFLHGQRSEGMSWHTIFRWKQCGGDETFRSETVSCGPYSSESYFPLLGLLTRVSATKQGISPLHVLHTSHCSTKPSLAHDFDSIGSRVLISASGQKYDRKKKSCVCKCFHRVQRQT